EPVVELNHQWLNLVLLHQIVERIGAVLAARERHDAVVVVFAAILLDQFAELLLARRPIDRLVLVFLLMTDVANALGVELDRLVSLGQIARCALLKHRSSSPAHGAVHCARPCHESGVSIPARPPALALLAARYPDVAR